MKLKDLKRDPSKLRKATLCHFARNEMVLLAMKKRGFGVGKWNGVGGKVLDGESVEDAAIRETKEEINVEIKQMEKLAILDFYFQNKPEWDQKVFVFLVKDWAGKVKETEEMKPQWFAIDSIPYKNMWPSDIVFLPKILSGEQFRASFLLDDEGVVIDQVFNKTGKSE